MSPISAASSPLCLAILYPLSSAGFPCDPLASSSSLPGKAALLDLARPSYHFSFTPLTSLQAHCVPAMPKYVQFTNSHVPSSWNALSLPSRPSPTIPTPPLWIILFPRESAHCLLCTLNLPFLCSFSQFFAYMPSLHHCHHARRALRTKTRP